MNTYQLDIAFTVSFIDPNDMTGDGMRHIHQRAVGPVQAKSRHDAYRLFRQKMNLTWPGRFSSKIRRFSIVKEQP